ncbi:hypothetical protein V1525DRAFT_26843 [Lipomyces kononenkoae]|uniref:Uncharacterized protein n=1 Tax=Lipomyces kononenkoae TaxID=34357 RepID=A0ACC3T9H5_LIPKO
MSRVILAVARLVVGFSLLTAAFGIPWNFANLTDSQTIQLLLECVDACHCRYNSTLGHDNELVIQPFERRELNLTRGSPDVQLYYCAFTVANRFWVVLASNSEYEEDIPGSTQLGSWDYNYLISHMPLLCSEAERPLEGNIGW